MKTKKLLILVAILIGLVVIVALVEKPFAKSEYTRKLAEAKPLFANFTKESAAKIEITASGQTTTLGKENGHWYVVSMDNYPADAEGVQGLLEKVAMFKTSELVSNNPEKQAEFEVDSSGVEAELLDAGGNTLAHLFLGKTTPGYLSSYLRAANSNNVYVGKGNLKSTFDKGSRSWKDRTIFSFNKGDVTPLSISSEEEIELKIDAEGKWEMLAPFTSPVKQTELDTLLQNYSALDADEFAGEEDLSKYGFDPHRASVSATLNDGSTRILLVGKEEDGKHYAKRKDNDSIFMLYAFKVDQLLKSAEDLKDDAPVTESNQIDDESDESDGSTASEKSE